MSAYIIHFQSQLTGIMETVLKGAVHDITKLVEDSFLEEVLRSRQEIKALTERLQSSEKKWREQEELAMLKRVAYGKAEVFRKQTIHRPAETQSDVEEWFDVKEGKVNQGNCLWETLEAASAGAPTEVATCRSSRSLDVSPETPTHMDRDGFEFTCKEENDKEASCVNQERHRECLDGDEAMYSSRLYGSSRELASTGVSTMDTEPTSMQSLIDKPRHRRTPAETQGENYGLETLKKSEAVHEKPPQRLDEGENNNEQGTGKLNHQGFDFIMREAVGQQRAVFAQGDMSTVIERPGIPGCVEQDLESESAAEQAGCHLSTSRSHGEKLECYLIDSVSVKDEVEIQSVWSEEARPAQSQHSQHKDIGQKLLQIRFPCIASPGHATWFQKLCSSKVKNTAAETLEFQQGAEATQMTESGKIVCANSEPSKEIEGFMCDTSFPTPGNTGVLQTASAEEKSFSCLHCGKSFTLLRNLKDHQRYHTGKKSYTCTQCGKGFVYMCHLKVHLQSHTGERPFSCGQCGKSFTYLCNLKSHQIYHTGEKPFSCSQCGKSFSQLSHLKKHRLIHSGDRPHSCKDCGKKFSTNGELRRHQQIHIR